MDERIAFIAAYLVPGLIFAVLSLPWKASAWRNQSTLEYWIVWAVFWWVLLPYLLWQAVRLLMDRWSDYLAERRHTRNNR